MRIVLARLTFQANRFELNANLTNTISGVRKLALPPAWKVKREIRRISVQLHRQLVPLFETPRKVIHDWFRLPALEIKSGRQTLQEKVALVILFQPEGVAASTLFTLEHLLGRGWTPMVISNAPISPDDIQALTDRSAKIVVRPNVGYDFGAYRDGILILKRLGIAPTRLILMNDSTWFPLSMMDTTLERLEALNADLAGNILKIEDANNRARDHIESHLLMMGPRVLSSAAFDRFWQKYVMSSYRDTTIERGEKAFSQLAIKGAVHEDALLSREKMMGLLKGLDDVALLEVIRNIVHHRRSHRDMLAAMIASAESGEAKWRMRFLDWTENELSHSLQHLISCTFVYPAVRYGGMGFMKKSRELRFHLARRKILEMDDAGAIAPLHPSVRQEIVAATQSWTAPPKKKRQHPDHVEDEQGENLGP